MHSDDPDGVASEIADRFFGRVALFAARRLGDRSLGEDVAQETLRRVLAALREGRVDSLDALPAYVFQTARHVCLQYGRKQRRETVALERLQAGDFPPAPPSGLERLVSRERVTRVRAALARLRDVEREILREAFGEWSGAEEIASRLGLTPEAVRVRKHRALKRLGELLREDPPGNDPRGSGTSR